MKKKTLKAVHELYKSSRRGFVCYDEQEIIIAGNEYAAVAFTDISNEDRVILENLPGFGKSSVSILRFLDRFKNHYHEYYNDEKCCAFAIRDAQQEVKRLKSGRRGKSYCQMNMCDEFLVEDFDVVYNIELLADVAACLEEYDEYRSCNASFPKDRKNPIIVGGKYGYGIIMPNLKCQNIKHSDWRKSI